MNYKTIYSLGDAKKKQTLFLRKILLFFILINSALLSQTSFQKTIGGSNDESSNSIIKTSDGSFVLTGYTQSFTNGDKDVYLIKINPSGDTLWTRSFGGINADYGVSVKQTVDGGYIITGATLTFGAGSLDVYLIKTNSTGNIIWSKTYGGTSGDVGYDVRQTPDGGYLVSGVTTSFSVWAMDIFLIKTNSIGDTLWTKRFGWGNNEYINYIVPTLDGGFMFAGVTKSFGAGDYDYFIIKSNATGSPIWSKSIGGLGLEDLIYADQTSDSGFVLVGTTSSFGLGSNDYLVIKTDKAGNVMWSKTYGGIYGDFAFCAKKTADKGYVIGGSTYSLGGGNLEIYLVKIDSIGNLKWNKTYGAVTGNDYCLGIETTSDKGFILTGETNSFSSIQTDIYLIRTDSLGNTLCNQNSLTTQVNSHLITAVTQTFVTSIGAIVSSPPTLTKTGANVNTLCAPLAINSLAVEFQTFVYPNPFTLETKITFNNTSNELYYLEIYDLQGRLVEKLYNLSGNTIEIKKGSKESGMYYFYIKSNERSNLTQGRFIVQ